MALHKSLVVLSGLLFASCALFTIPESEPPDPDTDTDPFNFQYLFKGYSERFDRLNHTDLFSDGFTYREGIGAAQNKDHLIDRLRSQQQRFPALFVDWFPPQGAAFPKDNDTARLNNVKYEIYRDGKTGAPTDSGHADFRLFYSDAWRICFWQDFPEYPAGALSFFNPDNNE